MVYQTGGYKVTIRLSTLGTSGALVRLAPDLTYSGRTAGGGGVIKSVVIDPSGAGVTALSLTGKWAISDLAVYNSISEDFTLTLTVDGTPIWDKTETWGASRLLLGTYSQAAASNPASDVPISCESTLTFFLQSTTDTSVTLYYSARPIL